eukprot:PhM_4_TR5200/c0_g1_i2/m.50829/K00871/PHKG; phosphorylase kinase gamma subunit
MKQLKREQDIMAKAAMPAPVATKTKNKNVNATNSNSNETITTNTNECKNNHLVSLHEQFESDDGNVTYTVMEMMKMNLEEYVQRTCGGVKRPRESDIANIMKCLLTAVSHLHNHNIAHRDISLANILMNDVTDVRLADFGLAMDLSVEEGAMVKVTPCGTPMYMAPETLRLMNRLEEANTGDDSAMPMKRDHVKATDVWGCGVVLFMLLSGTTPFPMSVIDVSSTHHREMVLSQMDNGV